ncbi:phosphohexomutase domain-containing protein [Fuscibacter oryzae]|uniref:Phosphomannomutase n=1 Tax=Fuscibacter oryzae TaxID=2803939 RepID=A0A8J7SW21_9RHOB|nr:phosphomannomutase [Fuscibacter oryzae]MBL4929236.1 phosphomannomutase [Fuscibacter oryzae]
MAPKFGTSGLRGLVVELTDDLVADHVRAFMAACPVGTGLWIGRDLRPSSPALAAAVAKAARAEGVAVTDCGAVPTPALALAAMQAGAAAVMVTGSHIPADRNGLKFYLPSGEIAKSDEAAILANLGRPAAGKAAGMATDTTAGAVWVARYVTAFGPDALRGLRIGVWAHSAVSRDLLGQVLTALGAKAIEVGRSDHFIPVDTEAVAPEARTAIAAWVAEHRLDALISTDGDGDRPLLADAAGQVVPGDVLGQITAAALGAGVVVTPVSSNSGAEASRHFARVDRTKIGSPFVIAGMAAAGGRVVGYEANGGFLLGFAAQGPAGLLPPLATRDSLLPLIATLTEARRAGGVAARVAQEPARFTAADRLENTPTEAAAALLARLIGSPPDLAALLAWLEERAVATDLTDGLRVTLASGRVLHLRPSGNAPEFRIYAEAETSAAAQGLMGRAFALLAAEFPPDPA